MPVILGSPSTIVTANLALHLNAGNTTSYSGSGTTWTDLSTSQVNATLGSTVTYTNPYFTFNGANTVVTTTDWPTWNGQAHTVETWVYPTSTLSQQGVLFEKGPAVSTQYNLGFENNGTFFYNTWGLSTTTLSFTSSGNITLNAWNHIVCTYNGAGTKTIYVNAVQKAQATSLTGVLPTSPSGYNGSSIGVYGGPTGSRGYYFNGRIAIVRLYSSALSATDVAQNFNADAATFGLTPTASATTTYDGVVVNGALQYGAPTDLGTCISIQSFTATGTYTAPAGTTRVMVQVMGGGGGSAGYGESGGGGGFAEGVFQLSAGTSVTVTIGGGGGGVTYYAVAGQGGTTSFGSYISATGGQGANQYIQHGGGAGGLGAGGQTNLYGGTGTGHMNYGNHAQSGCGGYSYYGGGGSINRHNPSAAASYSMAIGAGATGNEGNDGSVGTTGPGGMIIVYAYK